VIRQDLFSKSLVAGKREATGIASGIGLLHQFEITDDVLVEQNLAVEFFQEIDRNVRFEFLDGLPTAARSL
jgi:hypothetical protein